MQQANVLSNIIVLWRYLGKKRQTQFSLLLVLMLVSVFAEVVSIGAVIPFLSALTDPEALFGFSWFQPVINILGIKSPDELLLPLTLGFVMAAIFSAGVRLLLLWFNARLASAMAIQLRSDVYTKTLYQSYEFHVAQNSSQLISMVTEKVGATINADILNVLMLVSALVMSLAIISTLLLINALAALFSFVVLGGGYIFIGYLVRARTRHNGSIVSENQPKAIKCVQEGLGGIRDIIIDSSQDTFRRSYVRAASKIHFASMQNVFFGGLPKPILEMLGITLIAALAYWFQMESSEERAVLPMLGALALGAQRLLPSLQQIYYSWSNINSNQAVLAEVISHLYRPPLTTAKPDKPVVPLTFCNNIELSDISFQYAEHSVEVLENIDLKILKGSRVGIMGSTGSGKSTLLDIVMGLLSPTKGKLIVDGLAISDNNVRAWQKNIAHVPQNIFLSDTSMTENIAFGIHPDQIDLAQVKQAAKQAQIDKFIEGLPEGYETLVGERGIRLSGGQRQRIGIARALYKQSDVIIFDEATSALDTETERAVTQAIENLGENLTIIVIAHRLSTLEGCNEVFEISGGKISFKEKI